jgi:hypothetical protein
MVIALNTMTVAAEPFVSGVVRQRLTPACGSTV